MTKVRKKATAADPLSYTSKERNGYLIGMAGSKYHLWYYQLRFGILFQQRNCTTGNGYFRYYGDCSCMGRNQ